MSWGLIDYLGAFVGLLLLTYVIRQFRLYVLRKKADREKAVVPPPAAPVNVPIPEPEYVPPPEPPPAPVNQVEEYYRRFKQDLSEADRQVALKNQEAQFLAVEHNRPQLLTIYDPADVKAGDPLCKLEDFPLDDMRRNNDSGHPAANQTGEVVILDFRTPRDEMTERFLPAPFRERYAALAASRKKAITEGALSRKPSSVDAMIEESKAASAKNREQANKDFAELLPEIRKQAETIAREKMVPNRMEDFKKEAEQHGVDVVVIIDQFVKSVGDTAEAQAKARFQKAGPLSDSNALLSKCASFPVTGNVRRL